MERLVFVRHCAWGVLPLACLCLGCSGNAGPQTVRVEGRVTLRGQPVDRGTVIFHPDGRATSLHPATGQIKTDGTYRMSSFGQGDGVVPGEYKVGVRSIVSGPTPDNPSAPFVWAVPEKYIAPTTSGLTASIAADGPARMEINFELK